MRTLILSLVACLLFNVTNAQFKTVAEGPVFRELGLGYGKILQLKNGGTLLFYIREQDDIIVRVYDEQHAEKAVQTIEPAYGHLKSEDVAAIFEIDGDGILLISGLDNKVLKLYRLIIDGKKGTLKSETVVADFEDVKGPQSYAMTFGGNLELGYFVRKDPYSDNYAVVQLNGLESDRNKRLEIIFFNKEHKEIGRSFFKSPGDRYKYLKYIDMVVIGDQKVCVLAYDNSTKGSGGKESKLVIATLEKDMDNVTLNELNPAKNYVVKDGLMRYNPATKQVILVGAVKEKPNTFNSPYQTFMMMIDPFANTPPRAIDFFPKKAGKEATSLFGDEDFGPVPQNVFVNEDGSFSVVFEELKKNTINHYVESILGSVAIAVCDKEGKEISGYLIPKRQKLGGSLLSPFYHSRREGTAQYFANGNQYKSFSYLARTNKSYVLINDLGENTEKVSNGKIAKVSGVSDCDAFYYPLVGKDVLPTRDFVFGAPDKGTHNLALFSVSDYNAETNLYVTLRMVKGRDEGIRLVWLSPQ